MKKMVIRKIQSILAAFILIGSVSLLEGLDPAKEIDQYNIDLYSTEDGLPQSSILALVQTKDGYLWMGTYEGIARFDGNEFNIFNKSNTPEMESNRIKCLLEDRTGCLWIGTSGGLLRYSGGKFENHTTKDGLSNDFVTCLCEDTFGRLWIGTTGGLNRFEKGTFTSFTRLQGLSDDYVMSVVEEQPGQLWIGTAGAGIFVLQGSRISRIPIPGLPENLPVRILYRDRDNSIWIGTGGQGLVHAKKGEFRIYSEKGRGKTKPTGLAKPPGTGLTGDDIRAITRDSQGTLWIGTNGQGLNRLKNGAFSFSASKQGYLNHPIRSIIEDREGSLWVGTRSGLAQLKDGKFIIYNSRNGLPVDSVRSVFQDREKNIWVGTVNGGLVRFGNGRFKTFGMKAGLRSKHIWTIAQSRDGAIWLGTYGEGLHRLKNGKITQVYTRKNGLGNNVVRAVFVDRENRIWVGSNGGGVDLIKDGKIINYSTRSGLSDDFVYAISEDKLGDIWIGTYSGSIDRFRDGRFTTYGVNDGLPGHAIWAIYPDEEDTIWIGTDGGGLLRFKDNRFTRLTVKDGLYSDLAFRIVEDNRQNLWMNCNHGIYRIRKQDVEAYLKGKIQKIPHISFGKLQGIKNTECNGPAQPAGLCSADGKLWFPTIRGVVVIDPEHIKINKILPPVIIEAMTADETPVYSYPVIPGEKIDIRPGKKRVEFKYTGLSFMAPGRVKFKYKLDGYDENWLDSGARRRVSYTNITPGDYTFRVIACNDDGKWNSEGANLSFTLKAFFWQTWWFRVLLVITFAFLSYLVIGFVKTHMRLIAFWKRRSHIASYEIDEQIGIGGMGIIYKVHSLIDRNKTFAMKVMKEEYLLDEVQKKRFKNESLLVDRLDHPNIVKVYERGEDNDKLYIVMELLEGKTLADRYESKNYPTVAQCIHIMRQVADILVNLCREDIIHRDLKPENIMLLTKNGDPDFVKLLDFGIARTHAFTHLTATGQVVGTLPYMAPEVISDGTLSAAVDVYSLGVIGYEMLTRRKPFPADNPVEILNQVINTTPPNPSEINRQIPQPLNDLVLKMIEKKSGQRPGAAEVKRILTNIAKAMTTGSKHTGRKTEKYPVNSK